jgi:cell division protein FtsB
MRQLVRLQGLALKRQVPPRHLAMQSQVRRRQALLHPAPHRRTGQGSLPISRKQAPGHKDGSHRQWPERCWGSSSTRRRLETERDNLLVEATAVSEAVQKTIYENAHVAQDQANYQQKYDALVKRYDELKNQIDDLNEQISTTQANKAGIEDFLDSLRENA